MIKTITKDITTVDVGIVAHGVNCQHKMGSGVARAIRTKWPEVYEYFMASPSGVKMLGTAHIVNIRPAFDDLFVVNCYTQNFYGYGGGKYANLNAISESLREVFKLAETYQLDIFLPKIGAGLGGLDWESEVFPIIQQINNGYDDEIVTHICEWS